MIYVLEVYSWRTNKVHQVMYSDNTSKFFIFMRLAREYRTTTSCCEQTFFEFCKGKCSDDWLDDFESLFNTLNTRLSAEDWWNELQINQTDFDIIQYF